MTTRTRVSPALLPNKKRAMLEIIDASARNAKTCPSLARLSQMLQIGHTTAGALMREMKDDGLISWRIVAAGVPVGQIRVVTIAATGLSTAVPQKWGRPPIAKRSDQLRLDHAKAVLMRRFPIVHSAEITEGPTGRGFFIVDKERITEAEMLKRAGEMAT